MGRYRLWTPKEDAALKKARKHTTDWAAVSQKMHRKGHTRSEEQCLRRWVNYVRPGLTHGPPTDRELKALSVLRTQAAAEGVSMLDVAKRTLPGRGDSWVYRQLDALVPSPVPNRRDKRSTGTASPTPSTRDSEDAEHVAAARSSRPDRRSMGTVSPTPSTSDGEDAAHVASVPGRAGSRAELLRPRRRQPSPLAGPSAPIGADDAAGVALASGVDEAKRTSDMVAQFALSVFEGCAEGQPPARRQAVGVLTRYLTAPQERESFAIVKAKGELGMQLWKHTERNYDADLERLRPLAEGAIKRMLARY